MLQHAYEITEAIFEDEIINYNKQEQKLFLLIDGVLINKLDNLPAYPEKIIYLFKNTIFEKWLKDSPILFEINFKSPWFNWFKRNEALNTSLMFLSDYSIEHLAKHVKNLLKAKVSNHPKELLFRFYDPRNFTNILNSFTPQEFNQFMGPVSNYYWFKDNHLFTAVNHNPNISENISPWLISHSTELAIIKQLEDGWAKDMVQNLENSDSFFCWFKNLAPAAALAFTFQTVENAKSYGLTQEYQMNFWGEWQLKYGCDFKNDPQYPWAAIIPKNETPQEMLERLEIMIEEFEDISLYGVEAYSNDAGDSVGIITAFWRRLWLINYNDLALLDTSEKLKLAMAKLYPERYKATKLNGLDKAIEKAESLSEFYGLPLAEGRAMLAAVMWFSGHKAWENDFARPWFKNILEKSQLLPQGERSSWLFKHLKRRINTLYRPYKLTELEEAERLKRRQLREILVRYKNFTLADMWRRDISQEKLSVGIINYVGENYLNTVDIDFKNHCLKMALNFAVNSKTGNFFSDLQPLWSCFFFYSFLVMELDPSSLNLEQSDFWIAANDKENLRSSSEKLEYLQNVFANLLNKASAYLLFHKDSIKEDAVDDNIFADLY